MKIFKISVMALLLSATFIACKKDKDVESEFSQTGKTTDDAVIKGIWKGEYITTSKTPPVYFSFEIKTGGVLHLLDETQQVIGSGTWVLDGSSFNAIYIVNATQLSYSVKGNLTTSPEKISGEWQYDQPYQDKGFWYMDKVN